MSEKPTQAEIDEANASHAQEVLEQEWREEFESFNYDLNLQRANDGFYVSPQATVRWNAFKKAKQSSQAALAEKDRKIAELERNQKNLFHANGELAERNDELTRQNTEQAKLLAVMRKVLKNAEHQLNYVGQGCEDKEIHICADNIRKALSATPETVEKYLDEVRAKEVADYIAEQQRCYVKKGGE